MNPLDGLDLDEQELLKQVAENNGVSLAAARKRRDEMQAVWTSAMEDTLNQMANNRGLTRSQLDKLIASHFESEKRLVDFFQYGGVNVRGLHQALLYAERGKSSTSGGANGGKASKRRLWAEWAGEQVSCWDELPESGEEPLKFEVNEMEIKEIYRDGDKLIAFDPDSEKESSLARSTFEKRYLSRIQGR